MFKIKSIWTILAITILGYITYQTAFAFNEKNVIEDTIENVEIPEDKTIFLMVTDEHYGVSTSEIKQIRENINLWEFDKKTDQIFLKHNSMLPNERTKIMAIYDKGYDSFEHHADVLSLINTPYEHFYDGESVFKILGIGEDGSIQIEYKGKIINLAAGESYWSFGTEGYKLTKTVIKNYGIYDKSQFMKMKTKEELEAEKNKEPKKLQLEDYSSYPLIN